MKYHTLITRDGYLQPFAIQFGDYDRRVVVQEKRDSYAHLRGNCWMIVTTGDTQQEIESAVAKINALKGFGTASRENDPVGVECH